MPNTVARPEQQDERARLDDLERNFDSPAAREKTPTSTDELERHFAMPSAREPVYKKPGNEPSDAPGKKQPDKGKSRAGDDSSDSHSNVGDGDAGKSFYRSSSGRHDDLNGLANIKPTFRGAIGFARNNRGKLIFGGVAAGFVTLAIIAFLALLPFKIMHIVNNLQNRFTASATSALENETDTLFSNYVKKYILPAHKKCGAVIDSRCNSIPTSTNPITRLYKGWRTANFEQKLKDDYGLEFSYSSGHYYMKTPLSTSDIDISGFETENPDNLSLGDWLAEKTPNGLRPADISEIRQSIKDATAGETLWKKTYIRLKFSKYLHEKFGAPKCIFFCDTVYGKVKDKFANFVSDQKNAGKLVLNRLVIMPRDQTLGVVMDCIFSGCDPTTEKSQPTTPGENGELNGAPESQAETNVTKTLGDLAAEYPAEDPAAIKALYDKVASEGLTQVTIERVLKKLMCGAADCESAVATATAEQTVKLLTVVGWILLADQVAHLVNAVNNSPETLKKLSYVINSAAAVNLDAVYNVYNDELKTGNVNPTELGSMVNSLGPVAAGASQQDLKGGTAGAEQSPLYSYLIDNQSPAPNSNYKCDDGSTPAATDVQNAVCPEEKLGGGNNKLLEELHKGLNEPTSDFYIIGQAARLWSGIVGGIPGLESFIKWVNGAMGSALTFSTSTFELAACHTVSLGPLKFSTDPTGGFCAIRDAIKKGTQYITEALVKDLIPNPFSENMSGARTFDMMAAGADVSGNDYAHSGLGGKELTPTQVTANLNQQESEDYQRYLNQPVLARIFDTNSNYSPITKLAMAMPTDKADAVQAVASFFTNPLKDLGSAFGSIFHIGHAYAAATPQADPFGVVQYGYTTNDPTLAAANQDPEAYWNEHCSDNPSQGYQSDADYKKNSWNAASLKTIDQNTGMPVNKTTNPCLLLQATAAADGALFTSDVLTPDDTGQ